LSANTADSASQLVDRLVNDAQFRDTVTAAPTRHDQAQVIRAAGYGDVSMDAILEALKEQAAALGAGVQVDPERVKRVEELCGRVATDPELRQALQAAATPEAQREVLAQAGYGDISLDDLRAAAAQVGQREELSDQELELVSGGAFEAAFGVGTLGAGIGFATAGPLGACAGFVIGAIGSVLTEIAIAYTPPPSDW
jgi:predicted ribosomally synthesized peptide with nif11-like leader